MADAKANPQDDVKVLAGQDEPLPKELAQPSGEKKPEPSKPVESLTKDQVDKLLSERHSTLDKKIAKLEKALSESNESLETLQREREEAELERIGDDPDAITSFEAKKKLKEREAAVSKKERELEARIAEQEEVIKEAQVLKLFKQAEKIASKYESVKAEDLMELTDGSPERMELLAARLGKLKENNPDKPIVPRPDSGISSGGISNPTQEQLEKMNEAQYHEWASKRFAK